MISSLALAGGIDAVLADVVIESAVKNTEKEEGEEEHDDKVTDENIVSAVAHVLPHLCGTDSQLTLCQYPCGGVWIITEDWVEYLRVVCLVAGPQLIEPGDVPEESAGDDWDDKEVAGVS